MLIILLNIFLKDIHINKKHIVKILQYVFYGNKFIF